ncbi:MAG: ATP-binding cassette domain-containing protein, partial [Candidatus Kapaibacterium sp.]
PGGRCEVCQGEGYVTVDMQFLADIQLVCDACKGTRFKSEVRNAKFNGKSIVDVLAMTVEEALQFFKGQNRITRRLQSLSDVGLGYIRLGQPATTLSGGEAQRVKLASHLTSPDNGHTLFILDEPTTGLHMADVAVLLKAFSALIEKGHSVLVIEHNLDVIKTADHVIDLGPEGGEAGGSVVASGTPEQIAAHPDSITGHFLKPLI